MPAATTPGWRVTKLTGPAASLIREVSRGGVADLAEAVCSSGVVLAEAVDVETHLFGQLRSHDPLERGVKARPGEFNLTHDPLPAC